jgi:hypothetical protein
MALTQQLVSYAIHKWANRKNGVPKDKTRRILFDLSITLGWYLLMPLKIL